MNWFFITVENPDEYCANIDTINNNIIETFSNYTITNEPSLEKIYKLNDNKFTNSQQVRELVNSSAGTSSNLNVSCSRNNEECNYWNY